MKGLKVRTNVILEDSAHLQLLIQERLTGVSKKILLLLTSVMKEKRRDSIGLALLTFSLSPFRSAFLSFTTILYDNDENHSI